jgi:hypothetical protein
VARLLLGVGGSLLNRYTGITRIEGSNPFLSAITPYANSLSGSGRGWKGPITAGFSGKAPDFPLPPKGLSGLSLAVSLQSS